jgi:hypothetical protein
MIVTIDVKKKTNTVNLPDEQVHWYDNPHSLIDYLL